MTASRKTGFLVILLYLLLFFAAAQVSLAVLLLLAFLVLGALALTMLNVVLPGIERFAFTLPLVLLGLVGYGALILGAPPSVTLLSLIVIALTAIVIMLLKFGPRSLEKMNNPAIPLTALVPIVLLALSSRLFAGNSISWLMVGDGLPQFRNVLAAITASSQSGWTALLPPSRSGVSIATLTVWAPSAEDPTAFMVGTLEAFTALVLVSLIAGTLQLINTFGQFHIGIRGVLQGILFGLLICSGALAGQASNGFINVALAFPIYVLALVSANSLYRKRHWLSLAVGGLAVGWLLFTWPPLAMAAVGVILAALVFQGRTRRFLILSLAAPIGIILGYWLASDVHPGIPSFPAAEGFYYFHVTPLASFGLLATILILIASRSSGVVASLSFISAGVGGGLALFLVMGHGDVATFLADTQVNNSSTHYYEQKFIAQLFLPLTPLILAVMMRREFFAQYGKSFAFPAIIFLMATSFLLSGTPNFPWYPLEGREAQKVNAKFLADPFGFDPNSDSSGVWNDNSTAWYHTFIEDVVPLSSKSPG